MVRRDNFNSTMSTGNTEVNRGRSSYETMVIFFFSVEASVNGNRDTTPWAHVSQLNALARFRKQLTYYIHSPSVKLMVILTKYLLESYFVVCL